MKIYIYSNDKIYDEVNKGSLEIVKYVSEHIPRVGEIIHCPHIGGFYVKNVIYRISDDADYNDVMWVELGVEPIKKENKK